MKRAIIDLIDDFKNVELGQKGLDIVWTALLILAGIYWIGLSNYGALFQLTGCFAYFYCACKWINKTTYGAKMLDSLKSNE